MFIARVSNKSVQQKGTVLATVDTRLDAKHFKAGARYARCRRLGVLLVHMCVC